MSLSLIYSSSLALLTDFYQITMAYGYWKSNKHNQEAVFHLFYRKQPFDGGFSIAAGLEYAADYISNFRFTTEDIQFLKGLKNPNGEAMFEADFLIYLSQLKLQIDLDAVEEGSLIFPNEPLIRVKGPLLQCQLLETPLLNIVNFQTLIATKSARIRVIAGDDRIMEFGLRRAQGIDGSLSASRAAYIGGVDSTSNVLASKIFNIPVSGTHAHSWILSFESELEAFERYAEAMPGNCVFLVDTFDSIKGVEKAIIVGQKLRKKGKKLLGIRLDSGDLAYLSNRARQMLDLAGFDDCAIIVSNDLDERLISSLKLQGAKIDSWGIGTKLATAYDQPALGGVYKLSALKVNGVWEDKIKLSEQSVKINHPGIQQIRRFSANGKYRFDMIYDVENTIPLTPTAVDPNDITHRIKVKEGLFEYRDILIPIFRGGQKVYISPGLSQIRDFCANEIKLLDPSHLRLENPHVYPVGLEQSLFDRKLNLILKHRSENED